MNISSFQYTTLPITVCFGEGSFEKLPGFLTIYKNIFIVANDRNLPEVDWLKSQVSDKSMTVFTEIVQHVPVELVSKALGILKTKNSDVIVAIGGGSSIGLAKALAKETAIPIIAIPTTYAGSEMTSIWGTTDKNGKTTGRSNLVLPKVVLYDPRFTAQMPRSLAVMSSMNAMAHLMEALYAHDTNPITYQNSLMAIQKIVEGLQLLLKSDSLSLESNLLLQFGAHIAGKSLSEVSMSLHHKAAHVLGGTFGLEHAAVHTVLQAYVLDFQWDVLTANVQSDFKLALNHPYPPLALLNLIKNLGAPFNLSQIGFKEEDISKTVVIMLTNPYANPKPLTKHGLTQMLQNAFDGVIV